MFDLFPNIPEKIHVKAISNYGVFLRFTGKVRSKSGFDLNKQYYKKKFYIFLRVDSLPND